MPVQYIIVNGDNRPVCSLRWMEVSKNSSKTDDPDVAGPFFGPIIFIPTPLLPAG